MLRTREIFSSTNTLFLFLKQLEKIISSYPATRTRNSSCSVRHKNWGVFMGGVREARLTIKSINFLRARTKTIPTLVGGLWGGRSDYLSMILFWISQFHSLPHYPNTTPLHGSHGLSTQRAQRTKSSRSERPQTRSCGSEGP